KNRSTVARPGRRQVVALVDGQALRRGQFSASRLELCDVDVGLVIQLHERKSLSINGASRGGKGKASPVGDAGWLVLKLSCAEIDTDLPKIGVVHIGGRLSK